MRNEKNSKSLKFRTHEKFNNNKIKKKENFQLIKKQQQNDSNSVNPVNPKPLKKYIKLNLCA